MIRYFMTVDGTISEREAAEPGCWIELTHPTSSETELIAERYKIDIDDLRAPLDEEELKTTIPCSLWTFLRWKSATALTGSRPFPLAYL